MAKTDGVARIIALAALGKNGGGSTGGTTNYLDLINKPKINNVELTGNKTLEDLGINIPELPIASADTLGGIKIGENLTIDENGVVSASGGGVPRLYSCFCEKKCSVGAGFYLQNYDTVKNMLEEAIENYVNNQVIPICSFNFPTNNRIQYIANLKGSLYAESNSISFPNKKQNYFHIDSDRFVINQDIYYYSIQITGSWTDDKFTVTQVYCSPYKNKILSSDFTPASEQYVDNSIKAAITDALGGSY